MSPIPLEKPASFPITNIQDIIICFRKTENIQPVFRKEKYHAIISKMHNGRGLAMIKNKIS